MPRSPSGGDTDPDYATAWAAITEWIEGDGSWSGRERNICYLNNGDGTFWDVSAAVGLDFAEDGRAFAAGDLDGDGDPDLAVKARDAPGLRIVRNDWAGARAVTVRLRGTRSNRDGIGAEVWVRSGSRVIRKAVRAGSGFLSQHSKQLHFGLGDRPRVDDLRVRWPSGLEQTTGPFAADQLVTVVEGAARPGFSDFRDTGPSEGRSVSAAATGSHPFESTGGGTWLAEPVVAPAWELAGLDGTRHTLDEERGALVLLNIWASWCPPCRAELRDFQSRLESLKGAGIRLVAVAVDDSSSVPAVRALAREEGLAFPVLLADDRFRAGYATLVRALLAHRAELGIPTSLLINPRGQVEKVYPGPADPADLIRDARRLRDPAEDRLARALPMPGQFFGPRPERDYTRLGADMLDVGLADAAVPYLRAAVRQQPESGPAHYNLGTAYAASGLLDAARASFESAVRLKPAHAEAHNSLGATLAKAGRPRDAIPHFRAATASRPGYAKAIGNLARAHERLGEAGAAIRVLEAGIRASPLHATLRNRLGTLLAGLGELDRARVWFEEALGLAPDDPETLTNLALLEAQRGRLGTAAARLRETIADHPSHGGARWSLARVQASAGEAEAARQTLLELLELEPGHGEARQMLESLPESPQ